MNVPVQIHFGNAAVGTKWPKGATITSRIVKNADGRFEAYIKLNDYEMRLPGTHPTERDAQITIAGTIAENRND